MPDYEPTVTVNDILSHAYFILNESGLSDFIDDTESIGMINYAMRELYQRTERLQKTMSLNISSNNNNSPLPSDFMALSIKETPVVYYAITDISTPFSPVPLRFIKYQEFIGLPISPPNIPSKFSISYQSSFVSGTLYIYPPTIKDCSITGIYTPLPPVIENVTDTVPIDPFFVMPMASIICWLYKYKDREPNYGDRHYVMWDTAIKRYNMFNYNRLDQPTLRWKFLDNGRRYKR